MGTDIHMAAEVRKNNKWELVKQEVFPYPYEDGALTSCPYMARNYDLFAMLADVRNGYGFAGCPTGTIITPIADPKGYPEDMDPETMKMMSEEHSASYLTLQELLDYDWEGQFKRTTGVVSKNEYAQTLYHGKHPLVWCGGAGGQGIVMLSEEEMIRRIRDNIPDEPGKKYYTRCEFPPESYALKAGSFYSEVIPILKTLIPEGGTPSDVRIVFDFDS